MEFFIKNIIKEEPLILGHSFGSVLTLKYAEEHSEIDKFILSGHPHINGISLFFGKMWTAFEGIFIKERFIDIIKNFICFSKEEFVDFIT